METEPVTVLGGFSTHMLVEPHKSNFLEQVSDLWSGLSHHKNRFPGPNPCSIEKSDFEVIRRQEYKICEKTDGYRMLLTVCMFGEYKLVTLISRAWDVYVIPLKKCPRVWYQGTVLDGELVRTSAGEWVWMGFDAIIVGGIPVYRDPLEDRLEALRRSMHSYRHSPGEVELRLKSYYNTLEEYQQYLPGLQHNVDGIILTPARLGITVGRHRQMYKLKNAGDHTVDFLYKEDGLHVYDQGGKEHVCVAEMKIDIPPGSIIECSYHGNTWKFHHVRHDKTTANDMLTYRNTLKNIDENIQIQEVGTLLTTRQ